MTATLDRKLSRNQWLFSIICQTSTVTEYPVAIVGAATPFILAAAVPFLHFISSKQWWLGVAYIASIEDRKVVTAFVFRDRHSSSGDVSNEVQEWEIFANRVMVVGRCSQLWRSACRSSWVSTPRHHVVRSVSAHRVWVEFVCQAPRFIACNTINYLLTNKLIESHACTQLMMLVISLKTNLIPTPVIIYGDWALSTNTYCFGVFVLATGCICIHR